MRNNSNLIYFVDLISVNCKVCLSPVEAARLRIRIRCYCGSFVAKQTLLNNVNSFEVELSSTSNYISKMQSKFLKQEPFSSGVADAV